MTRTPIQADEAIEVALDRAEELADYGRPLRQRVLEELPRMRIAGQWFDGKRRSVDRLVSVVEPAGQRSKRKGLFRWAYLGYDGGGRMPEAWVETALQARRNADNAARADGWLLWDPPLDRLATRLLELGEATGFVDHMLERSAPRLSFPAVWDAHGEDGVVRKLLVALGCSEPGIADGLQMALTCAREHKDCTVWYVVENRRQLLRVRDALQAERDAEAVAEGSYWIHSGGSRSTLRILLWDGGAFHLLGAANYCVVGCKVSQGVAETLRRRCGTVAYTEAA